jgi:competence ComEA-like helix-hairpin-helix protein
MRRMVLLSLRIGPCLVAVALTTGRVAWADDTTLEGVINLNTATPEELGLIPSVGPSRIRNILAYRHAHPFRTIDELARIKGIGRKTVRKWRQHLAVSGPSTAIRVRRPHAPVVPPEALAQVKQPAPARSPPRPPTPVRLLRPARHKGEPAHLARLHAPGLAELPPP